MMKGLRWISALNVKGFGLMPENLRPSQGLRKPILINCLACLRNKCNGENCDMGNGYHLNIDEVLSQFNSTADSGLSKAEASRRLMEYGPNELQAARRISRSRSYTLTWPRMAFRLWPLPWTLSKRT